MADQKSRLPLIATSTNRNSDVLKDARLINGFVEKDALGELWVYKRPGYSTLHNQTDGDGRGMYYISGAGSIIYIVGTTVYLDATSQGTVTAFGEGFTFTETRYSAPYFIKNSLDAYVYDDSIPSVTAVVDADYPAQTVPGAAYLDGTLYVMEEDGTIHGSAIDDPTSWDPLNVIVARNEAGRGVYLAKLLSLVVALKDYSLEFFYNAGNATGSPLGRYEGPNLRVGCYSAQSVQCDEDKLFWIAQSQSGGPTVMMLDKLNPVPISNPAIDRLFQGQGRDSLNSWLMRMQGRLFYGLRLSTPSVTLVYDVKEKLWYQWFGSDGLTWPIVATANGGTLPLAQHATNGKIFVVNPGVYLDDQEVFSWELYAPNYDGGVRVRKHLPQIDFIGDQVSGSLLEVRHNDDDYKEGRWSGFRIVDLGQPRPFLRDEGSFYRRAYHFRHRRNTALRLQAAELTIDTGYF